MQNWLFLIVITSSIAKWVPQAASEASMCSTENTCTSKEKFLRSAMGTSRMVHLGLGNSLVPNFLSTAQLIFTQKKRECLDEENVAATKHKETKGKQKNKKRLLYSDCCHTHLPMLHIKPPCLQTTGQTTINCNPESSIKTCIHMVKERTNGV